MLEPFVIPVQKASMFKVSRHKVIALGGVVYHCESKKGVRIDTEHQQLNVEL